MPNISLDQLPYDPDNLYADPLVELTQSSVSTFMACPQRFVLKYLMRLHTTGVSLPLVTGSAVHKAMERLLDPALDGVQSRDARLPDCLKDIDEVFERLPERYTILPEIEKLEHARAQAHAIIEAWHVIYGHDLEQWTVKFKEMVVRQNPPEGIHAPLLERMAGMIDGIVASPTGEIWILEHKTRKSLFGLSLTGLEMDFQVLWYLVLCYHVLRRKGETIRPRGFLYNGMMKPQHRINEDGFEDVKERMYQAMITDPEKYFILEPIDMPEERVDQALFNFTRIVKTMDSLSPGTVYQNLRSCADYGGCPFIPLCRAGAHVSNPRSVLESAEISLYEIGDTHAELEDDNVNEDVDKMM